MIRMVQEKIEELERLCRKYHVSRFEIFGSAAVDEFDPERSDIDFLVEFRRGGQMDAADQYFGLLEELESLFGRHVDLVESGSMRNPYFVRRADETRKLIYAS